MSNVRKDKGIKKERNPKLKNQISYTTDTTFNDSGVKIYIIIYI